MDYVNILPKPMLKSGLVFLFQILCGCYYLTNYDADMQSHMCSTIVREAAKHTPTALADINEPGSQRIQKHPWLKLYI